MTRGISEERLRKIGRFYMPDSVLQEFMSKECTELTPWMPIDENTPKDKQFLLYTNKGPVIGRQFVGEIRFNWIYAPTHFCELPDDPK